MDRGANQLALDIVTRLRSSGYQAFLVGGCVRDLLLGREAKDFDVTTDARPEQILALYPEAERIGAHFGVVLIHRPDAHVEVATFRSDHDYVDGRHPNHVRFETEARMDVLRRDFTVNALLLDPETNQVIDYVGGSSDLRAGIIRAIGDPQSRFREDHLRLLRAIRFGARLGFALEPATEKAIVQLAGEVQTVSAERVRDEIVRILVEGGARRGFEMLYRTGLLEQILPEIALMKGVAQPPEFHPEGDVWIHTLLMLERLPPDPSPTLALGVLLHDVGKPSTFRVAERIRFDGHVEAGIEIADRILNRLRFSKQDTEQIEALIRHHMRFMDVPRMKESTLKRFLRLPAFEEHLELHRLDCISSHGSLDNYRFMQEKLQELGTEQIAPQRLLTGNDLLAAGFKPGPAFGRILNAVEDAQLEGTVRTKEEALVMGLALSRQESERASI